jgi:hypothetical protein
MKKRFRLLHRGERNTFYCFDTLTKKRSTLDTENRDCAQRIIDAKNDALRQPALNLHIARAYLAGADARYTTRTWHDVFLAIAATKHGSTRKRWDRAWQDDAFKSLKNRALHDTTVEHFLAVLQRGTISTNVFLRRLHNFALDLSWLVVPILPKRQWPAVHFKPKRAITWDEHLKIIDGEANPERAAFYDLVWHLGGSQADIASLCAENIDWNHQIISFHRKKLAPRNLPPVKIAFGSHVASILQKRPNQGPLFPNLIGRESGHRATEFKRLLKRVGLGTDITLHSYRYAWAERAKKANYPERFAMEALGHNSKAVHRGYAGHADIELPALEDYERKIVKLSSEAA